MKCVKTGHEHSPVAPSNLQRIIDYNRRMGQSDELASNTHSHSTVSQSAHLIEAQMSQPSGLAELILAFLILLPLGIAFGIVAFMTILPSPWDIISFGTAMLIAAFAVAYWRKHSTIRTAQSLVAAGALGDLKLTLEAVGEQVALAYAAPFASAVAKSLIENKRLGTTGRISCTNTHVRVEPLVIRFEPLLLEESDSSFQALRSSIGIHTMTDRRHTKEQAMWIRKAKKSIQMRGGMWIVIVFGFNFLIAAAEAYYKRRITWQVVMWGSYLAMMFTSPVRGWFSTKEWHLVPGGLLLRTARMIDTKSTLHVFDRRNAALILLELRRRVWVAGVADEQRDSFMALTESEADMLLRAWLSPLVPPKVERLSDFQ